MKAKKNIKTKLNQINFAIIAQGTVSLLKLRLVKPSQDFIERHGN